MTLETSDQAEPPANPPAERRAVRRGRVLLGGKLVYGDGFSADCTIRDLTDGGAKVQLTGQAPAPRDGYLIVVRDGKAHRLRTSWKRHPFMGLTFEDSCDLDGETVPAAFRPLRAFWSAISPRSAT